MKISKRQLRKIIKEELQRSLLAESQQLYQGSKFRKGMSALDAFEAFKSSYRPEKIAPDTLSIRISNNYTTPGGPAIKLDLQILGFVEE